MSSILRYQLLNVVLVGLLAACGGDDEPFGPAPGSGGTNPDGGSGTSGSGGASGSGGTAGGSGCEALDCTPPATCDSSVATPRCVCPAGYEDVRGDGTNCRDIDECTAGTHDCHAGATCRNTPGSFECTCNAPAWTGDGKTCACATGYIAVGDQCLKDNAGPCTAGTECASGHCVGGVCCAEPCDTPGNCQRLEGTACVNGTTCRYANLTDGTVCDDGDACTNTTCFDGVCSLDPDNPGKSCSDNNACTTDSCAPGTAECVHTPVSCNDNNPCTTDTCSTTLGCQHTDNNAAACTDNDPCTDDRCQAGVCVSTPKSCASTDCTTGTCTNGTCGSTPKNVSGPCDDGLNACSTSGTCNASGACTGNNDACGPLAASCTTCTSGTNCFQGRLCTCRPPATGQPPNRVVNGVCVPDTNECNANPCVSVATCRDPTPDGSVNGDVVCTCPAGYTGTGKTATGGCVDINECTPTNPCGPGTCANRLPPQRYVCTCNPGYRAITPAGATGPTCACDLSGSFTTVIDTDFFYPPIFAEDGTTLLIEGSPPTGVRVRAWSIRHHTVAANGSVTVRTIPCGGLSPTVCDRALSAAHAQYQANQIWGRSKINAGFATITTSLVNILPGRTGYTEPQATALQGINLLNPAGPWPPCRQCVGVAAGGTCTCPGQTAPFMVTNPATWVDTDEDGSLGMTTHDVSRGGDLIDGVDPDPPISYTEPSECPRLVTPNATYDYMEWPGLANGVPFLTYRWYSATRAISAFKYDSITFDTTANQCVIAGSVVGPDAGRAKTDARFHSCESCSLIGCAPTGPCTDTQIDFYDSVEQTQQVLGASFTMRKHATIDLTATLALPDGPQKTANLNQACAEVREANCPAGKTCVTP